MDKHERIVIYETMLKLAKKASWRDGSGLCWFLGLSVSPYDAVLLDELPELMAQRPKMHKRKYPLARVTYSTFWWPKWNIWQRRIVLRRAIKMVKLAES